MKKRILVLAAAMLTALLFSGCALRTVDEMYRLPKRSKEYNHLQSAIDIAMAGLDYSAPLSGENQQTVQSADLDGDGKDEYLVFAKGTSENPMQILIFGQDEDGKVSIREVIAAKGSAFEQVEYVQINGIPGMEIVVGRQVSNQLMRRVTVYTFADGRSKPLMNADYSKLLTCDLNENGRSDLLLIQRGEVEIADAMAVHYTYRDGVMERSVEAKLSGRASAVRRIMESKLHGGVPAVYVASEVENNAIVTDVLALQDGKFTNICLSGNGGAGVHTLRNYYVFADDVDDDGVMELPSLISTQPVASGWHTEEQYLIRWYAMDLDGSMVDKYYSFHNYGGGWYLHMDSRWANRTTVYQVGNTYTFYVWDQEYSTATAVFTIFALSGSDRDSQATQDNRFALHQTDDIIYAARLESIATQYGITEDNLINSFHLIHEDWKTGET